MTDLAELGIVVRSDQAKKATKDLDNLTKSGVRAEKSVDKLGKTAAQSEKGMSKMAASLKVVAGGLAGLAGIRVFSGMASTIAEFEQAMSNVSAVSGATGASLSALTEQAKELGATTKFSASEAAAGMEFLARAGFSANQVMTALPATLNLAAAGALGLGEAADIASNIMSGFAIAAEEMTRVSDVLALTAASSNTNIQQLGEGMKFVAPISKAFGVSLENTSAIMGALGDAGIQASMAGTSLRQIMLQLNNPTAKANAALKQLGLTARDISPEFNDINTILGRLKDAAITAGDAQVIFGQRAASAGLVMVENADRIVEFTEELENAEGAAQSMADTMIDNLGGAFKTLSSAAEGFVLAIGDAGAANALRAAVDGLTTVVRTLTANMDALVTVAGLVTIAFGSKLVASVIASTAAMIKDTAAKVQNALAAKGIATANLTAAQSHATVTAAALADAKAHQAAIASLAIYGPARAAANVAVTQATAAHTAATAAVTAQTAAVAQLGIVARTTAATMGVLRGAMAFLGGPIGVAIAAAASAMFLLARASREAAQAQETYERALAAGNVALKTQAEQTKILAEETDKAHLAVLEKARAEQAASLASAKRLAETTGMGIALNDAMQRAGREGVKTLTVELANTEKAMVNLITKLSGGRKTIKQVGEDAKGAAEDMTEICAAAKEVGTCAERLQKKLAKEGKMLADKLVATGEGAEALKEFNLQQEIHNTLVENGIALGSEEAAAIEEQIRSNEQYREAIEDTNDALSETGEQAKKAAQEVDQASEILKTAGRGIQTAFTDMFLDIFNGGVDSFSKLGDAILDTFKRTLAEMATLAIARPIIVPVIQAVAGALGVGGAGQALASGFAGAGQGGVGGLNSAVSAGRGIYGYFANGGSLATLGAGFSTGFGLAGANIGAAGFTGSLGANASLIGSSFQSGAYGTALGAAAPYLPILGGAVYGYTQGGLGGAALGAGGAYAGAAIGSAILPGIGTVIGGALGGIVGGLFGGSLFGDDDEPETKIQLVTVKNFDDLVGRAASKGQGTTKTPFGIVGFNIREETSGKFAKGLLDGIKEMDTKIAEFLTESEIAQVAEKLQTTDALRITRDADKFGDKDVAKLIGDRLENIMSQIDFGKFDDAIQDVVDNAPKGAEGITQITDALFQFLSQREEVKDAITAFGRVAEPISEIAAAVKALEKEMLDLIQAAVDFGVLGDVGATIQDIAAGQTRTLELWRTNFDKNVADALLGITDPLALELQQFDELAAQRLADAELLGADILQVERLNALERQQILEQTATGITGSFTSVFDSLEDFVKSMGLAAASPLTARERLDTAQSLYDDVLKAVQAGDTRGVGELPQLAQQLLSEAQNFFAGTEGFSDIFREVNRELLDVLEFGGAISDPVITSIDTLGVQSVENTSEIVAAIEEVAGGNAEVKALLTDLVEQLTRILSGEEAA